MTLEYRVRQLLEDEGRRKRMAQCAAEAARPRAALDILHKVLEGT